MATPPLQASCSNRRQPDSVDIAELRTEQIRLLDQPQERSAASTTVGMDPGTDGEYTRRSADYRFRAARR